jgi:hypothetical protein
LPLPSSPHWAPSTAMFVFGIQIYRNPRRRPITTHEGYEDGSATKITKRTKIRSRSTPPKAASHRVRAQTQAAARSDGLRLRSRPMRAACFAGRVERLVSFVTFVSLVAKTFQRA